MGAGFALRNSLVAQPMDNLEIERAQRQLVRTAALAVPAGSSTPFSLGLTLPTQFRLGRNDGLILLPHSLVIQAAAQPLTLLNVGVLLQAVGGDGIPYVMAIGQLLTTGNLFITTTQALALALSPIYQLLSGSDFSHGAFAIAGVTPAPFPFTVLSFLLNGVLNNATAGAATADIRWSPKLHLVHGINE